MEEFAQGVSLVGGHLDEQDPRAKLERMEEKLELHGEGMSKEDQVDVSLPEQLLPYGDGEDAQMHHQE